MVVAQKLKESQITEQDSLLLTRNLLRIAIFNISYIRGLFPEKFFNDKSVPALEMKIKKLMPMDAESRRLIDWMEKGVYDALQKKYLRTLLFSICETVDGPMLEEYAFSFSYPNGDSQEVSMNINRVGSKKQGSAFKCNADKEITPNQMRSSACKMVRTLVQLMRTLDKMPEERTIVMKLLYYDDVTPIDYEPPFFRGCTEQEAQKAWTKNPLKMEIGNVNSKHFVLALKVKSVLDPCQDENDDNEDAVSLGGDSIHKDDFSDSDSDATQSDDDEYIVAPRDKQQGHENPDMADSDDTQDPAEDELAYGRVKDWVNSYHLENIELTDVLSNFSDISVVLIEEILNKLVKESILSTSGLESYTINKQKKTNYDFKAVKEEIIGQLPDVKKSPQGAGEDIMYMKALYHTLPLQYISVAKLHNHLKEATKSTVNKLIDRMTSEGFIEAKSNKRLGKRVIHSDLTEKKLMEVRKALDYDTVDMDVNAPHKSDRFDFQSMGNTVGDMSTCGNLHSIGSDLTRSRGKAETHQNGSVRREQALSGAMDHEKTPTSRVEPMVSLESFAPGHEGGTRADRNGKENGEFNTVCSMSSQNKRNRKASTVKEPILQYVKRQKAQAA